MITAGRGFFELDGRLLTALRGTMLWHLPGERTIYRNDFRDPNECIAFTDELMSYYHDVDPDLELLAAYAYGTLRWHAHRGGAGMEAIEISRKYLKTLGL